MDAELKAKWLTALRSGEFKQARNALHQPKAGGYCCLGVLCVAGGMDDTLKTADYDALDRIVGGLPIRDCLTGMNDKAASKGGKTFAEIADWIEANIPAQETAQAQDEHHG